jgi:hypothetical protein
VRTTLIDLLKNLFYLIKLLLFILKKYLRTLIILGFTGCILSTIYEVICRKMKWTVYEAGAAMSFYSNGRYLFNLRRNPDHAQALYGIRALALIWLMLGYRFILSLVAPLINPVAFVTEVSINIYLFLQ